MLPKEEFEQDIIKHTEALARLMGLDPVKYKVNISFTIKDDRPKFQELKR